MVGFTISLESTEICDDGLFSVINAVKPLLSKQHVTRGAHYLERPMPKIVVYVIEKIKQGHSNLISCLWSYVQMIKCDQVAQV